VGSVILLVKQATLVSARFAGVIFPVAWWIVLWERRRTRTLCAQVITDQVVSVFELARKSWRNIVWRSNGADSHHRMNLAKNRTVFVASAGTSGAATSGSLRAAKFAELVEQVGYVMDAATISSMSK
jgi:hypothetical protein